MAEGSTLPEVAQEMVLTSKQRCDLNAKKYSFVHIGGFSSWSALFVFRLNSLPVVDFPWSLVYFV